MIPLYLINLIALASITSPLDPIDEGDALWCAGSSSEATRVWRKAKKSEFDPIRAMAEYRLIMVASNLGWMMHGIRGDQALSQCMSNDPLCLLALADREILLGLNGLPSDTAYALDLLDAVTPILPGPAMARRVWMDVASFESLTGLEDTGGLGTCLAAGEPWPGGPERTHINLGFTFIRGGGMGGLVNWSQPNIDGHNGHLYSYLSYNTLGTGTVYSRYSSGGTYWGRGEISLRRGVYFDYPDIEKTHVLADSISLVLGPGVRWSRGQFWLGGLLRWDGNPEGPPLTGHGGEIGLTWQPLAGVQFSEKWSASIVDTIHVLSTSQLHQVTSFGFAWQISGDWVPVTNAPWWRLPTAGGERWLRLPMAQRFRSDLLLAATMEYRMRREHSVGIVPFVEGLWTGEQTMYGGAGLGVRLKLPGAASPLRMDVGYGTTGWGVSVDAREFF